MAKRRENKVIPESRVPNMEYMTEILNGYLDNNDARVTSTVSSEEVMIKVMKSMGLDILYITRTRVKGVCQICGNHNFEYTEACDGEKHKNYYDKLEEKSSVN